VIIDWVLRITSLAVLSRDFREKRVSHCRWAEPRWIEIHRTRKINRETIMVQREALGGFGIDRVNNLFYADSDSELQSHPSAGSKCESGPVFELSPWIWYSKLYRYLRMKLLESCQDEIAY
jgi:hypothetical protein